MRFFIFLSLLLVQLVFSNPLSDLLSSASTLIEPYLAEPDASEQEPSPPHDVPCYVVHPADYNINYTDDQRKAAAELRTHLESISTFVDEDFEPDGFIYWRVYIQDNSTLEQLKQHHAVREVQLNSEHSAKLQARAPKKPTGWIAFAKPSNDEKKNREVRNWLKKNSKNGKFHEYKRKTTGKVRWWAQFSFKKDSDIKLLRKLGGVQSVVRDRKWSGARAVPELDRLPTTKRWASNFVRKSRALAKREQLNWLKQEAAPADLVQISQYEDSKGTELKDFVFEERAGKDTLVYVVDCGVELDITNEQGGKSKKEFPRVIEEKLFQSSHSKNNKESERKDDYEKDPRGHGTPVASKILGSKYGIAKGATLIPVKVTSDSNSILEALEVIQDDLEETNRKRATTSILVMAMNIDDPDPNPKVEKESDLGTRMKGSFADIIKTGVPIVTSAGNHAKDRKPEIDSLPPLLGDEVDIIVVGATNAKGEPEDYSQGEKGKLQPIIYAPGTVQAQCKNFQGKQDDNVQGTSFAAPAVAGVIATYMSYNPPPWGEAKGQARVKAIMNYLKDKDTMWERVKGTPMIWNGADKKAHEAAKAFALEA